MELGFIESLRQRWDVLGISVVSEDEEKLGENANGAEDATRHTAYDLDETDALAYIPTTEEEGASLRKEIMQGAIVKSVITSAVQGTLARPVV